MRRAALSTVLPLAAAALLVAACGSSSTSSSSTSGTSGSSAASKSGGGYGGAYGGSGGTTKKPASTTTAAVVATTHGKLGTFLVGTNGRTLYLFEKDKTTTSTCSGACAAAWPPLTTTGKPTAKGAATASKLGTTKRSDGTLQVTYAGHPLYYYAGDAQPGQTTGQDSHAFGAAWYVVAPSGGKIGD